MASLRKVCGHKTIAVLHPWQTQAKAQLWKNNKLNYCLSRWIQLNSDRATQRRLPQNLQKVNSPFDGTLFNFNKIPAQEVLLKLGNKAATSGKIKDNEADAVVIINVSPLEFGNSLLAPNVTANIPQRITQEGLDLLVRLMLLSTDVWVFTNTKPF